MKKASIWISVVLAALMALAFVGCGKKTSQTPADSTQGSKALVVYFSVNDDTAKVADTIASATGVSFGRRRTISMATWRAIPQV